MSDMPMFCEVCNFSFDFISDFMYHSRFKCCRSCAMMWAEHSQEKWSQGWRPSRTEIDKYKNDRLALALHAKRMKYDIRKD